METIDLPVTEGSIPIFANIAELSLPTPGFEDTEWDTLNLHVRSPMCGFQNESLVILQIHLPNLLKNQKAQYIAMRDSIVCVDHYRLAISCHPVQKWEASDRHVPRVDRGILSNSG